ncbi:MAG: threonylcarbamoyl-AMP synthase [Clostridia bacterium]|nr:threonylcarbamoyl-AMP synthase [Clostridia bacterium]
MKTKIIYPDNIGEAAECIKNGGTVVFPTETVYGLGADAFNEDAIDKIYEAKGRPGDNPLIVHISEFDELDNLVCEVPKCAKVLMDKFWPGPLTLIFKKRESVPLKVTAGRDTVAVRFPSNKIAQRLIKESGTSVAAPSANLSGSPSPTVCSDVIDDLFSRVDYIIDATGCEIGLESTVVDVSGNDVVILRPGGITLEMIKKYVPDAYLDSGLIDEKSIPKCPGLKYTHYSPKADVTVVQGKPEKVREYILSNMEDSLGVLTYKSGVYEDADFVLFAGNNMDEYAHNLFSHLREFDKHNIKKVFAEFAPEPGIGVAVQNRLYKAAGHKVIEV